MDFSPATMCDLLSARLMAACTIAIAAAGGFAVAVDYSCFVTVADYFVVNNTDSAQTAKFLFLNI
jgi:hypothetical protein